MQSNRWAGRCANCGKDVPAGKGVLEDQGRSWGRTRATGRRHKYVVWCTPCFNQSDNSSYEDRACGDRAYEDACAEQCGPERY